MGCDFPFVNNSSGATVHGLVTGLVAGGIHRASLSLDASARAAIGVRTGLQLSRALSFLACDSRAPIVSGQSCLGEAICTLAFCSTQLHLS